MVVSGRVLTREGAVGYRPEQEGFLVERAEAGTPRAEAATKGDLLECRRVSFRTSGLAVQLQMAATGDARRVTGQLIPRQSGLVDIRHGRSIITVETDTLGQFSADNVPLGQLSLRCRLGVGRSRASVITGWVSV
jgi:hypothetical protein